MILITKIFNEIDKKDCVIKAHLNALNILIKKVIIISDYDDIKINNSKISLLHNRGSEVETLQYIIKSFPNETIIWSDSHTLFDSILSNFKNLPISQSNILYTKNVIIFNTNVKFVKSDSLIGSLIGNRIDISSQIEKGYNKPRKELPNITTKNIVRKIPNESIKISKIETIIVSVDYNDILIITLENNIKYLDSITVVTSSSDIVCQEICDKFGVNCFITDRMYENGAKFNKGKAINDGIRSLKKPDWVLLLDADILLTSSIDKDTLDKNILYTSSRYICDYESYKEWSNGEIKIGDIGEFEKDKGYGFFHLYNVNNRNVHHRVFGILFSEKSNNASGSDISFRNNFKSSKSIEQDIIHIGQTGVNWSGRKSEKVITELYKSMHKSTYTICSYYFNFKNDIRQKNNFIKFLEQFKDHYDNMIVGIIDYGDIDFEIPCKSIIIKGDVNNKLWSKEILINKIIDKVDTDYLLWIDGDLIYNNLDWLDNIDTIVGGNDFVQLFEDINYLGENNELLESHKSIISNGGKNIDSLLSKGYKPGGSWLGKVSILKDKKLFEKMYVGGGDTIFTYGLFNINNGFTLGKIGEGSKEIQNDATEWINRFGEYKVGYLNETVNHLYHGDLKDRNYNDRYKYLGKIFNKCKFLFMIPSYNRFDKIEEISKQILNIKGSMLVIINDGSQDDRYKYFNKIDNLIYLENETNYGKKGFWKTIDKLFKKAKDIDFEFGVLISDDLLFVENFEIKLNKYKNTNSILSLSRQNDVKNNWGFENWIDGVFCAPRKFYDDLEFEIYETSIKNNNSSSGVGQQMSKRLNELNWKVDYYKSLLIHNDEGLSVMHPILRKDEPLLTININDEPVIICGIATIYERRSSLEKSIISIIDQVDKLIVYQNGYKEIFDFLLNDKIEVVSSIDTGIDMGDAGKFYRVQDFKNCYYFSIDDDLLYPVDYVKNTINELENINNQSVVSYHGKKYDDSIKSYYNDIVKNYRCLDTVNENSIIDFPGTGVMCFHTKYLNLKFEDFEYPNMADVFLGIELRNKNKKCLVLKHQKGWIKHNNINLSETLFVRNRNNIRIDEVFNRRILPRFCIVTTMWKRHSLTDFVFSYYNKLRNELKNDINLILIACGSEFDISKEIAEKNNFIYIESTNFPLSQKHNKLFIKSKEFDPDGVILIGSDDFISKNILLTYKKIMNSYDYIGIKDFYMINEISEIRFWSGYENYRSNEPVGGGRFYKKTLLDKVDWTPWKGLEINKSLDYAFSKIIEDIGIERKIIECSEENGILFTIRTETNITKMENIGCICDGDIISKEIFDIKEILNFQKKNTK